MDGIRTRNQRGGRLTAYAVIIATTLAGAWRAAAVDQGDLQQSRVGKSSGQAEMFPVHVSPTDAGDGRVDGIRLAASLDSAASAPDLNVPQDLDLKRREQEIKIRELDVRDREAQKALAVAEAPWWRTLDPLLLAVLAAVFTMIGNMIVASINNRANIRQESIRSRNAL